MQDYLSAPSPFADQFGAAAITSWLIEKAKICPWLPIVNAKTARAFSLLAAVATTLGLHWAWQGAVNGGHVLTIVIPPWDEVGAMLWKTIGSYAMQEVFYQGAVKK